MDMQPMLTSLSPCGGFKIAVSTVLILLFLGCKRDPEATHHLYLENLTGSDLVFKANRDTSFIQVLILPQRTRVLFGGAGSHLTGNNITFQAIRDNYKWPGDTVEFYHNGDLVIRWGAPLREMSESINHFYNEKSWDITYGGRKDKWERGTFTIYPSDFGKIEGK